MTPRPLLACLLPVRNGAAHLHDWLASAERYADAVIALDDGSTDETADILDAHPLVVKLLRNPRRETYHGWDDAGNRNALLGAADEIGAQWLLSLDADERLDQPDGAALRAFVATTAVPGLAYGFRVHRMIDSLATYDRAGLWVYRLHAHEYGQRVPTERLHFVPIPTSIPPDRWIKTSLRIQHLASVDEAARVHRFEKYREVDPDLEYQDDYEKLLDPPETLHEWQPRVPGTPVIIDPFEPRIADTTRVPSDSEERPALSAIVISRNDEDRIERAVRAVVDQRVPEPFEVIVVVSGTDRTAEIVRREFPDVTLVELDGVALPGRARNAGLERARGEYVSFPGSHVELLPGSLAARLRAHEAGWDMITGTTVNGNTSYAGWSSYFLDHSSVLPGRPPTILDSPPAHCSYRTSILRELGGFPEDMRTGEDTVVNRELFRLGHTALRDPDVRLIHSSPATTLPALARHHFKRGRGMGRIVLETNRRAPVLRDRRLIRRLAVDYLPDRIRSTRSNVRRWGGQLSTIWSQVFPGFLVGAVSAWLGAWWEILRPRRGWVDGLLRHQSATTDIWVLCTGYCPCDVCCGEWANGTTSTLVDTAAQPRGIASDNDLVPVGTTLTIPGYGEATVDDTGAAMRQSARAGLVHLDLRFPAHDEALRWGSQWHHVEVPTTIRAAQVRTIGPDDVEHMPGDVVNR